MNKALIMIVALTLSLGGLVPVAAQGRPDEIALLVNGEPISTWEIGLLLPQIQSELKSQGLEPKGTIVIEVAMRRAADNKLLEQEAKRRGIEPNLQRIDQKLNALVEGAGGRASLEGELGKSGGTYEQLRRTVVQADLIQTLVESEMGSAANATDEQIEAYYSENLDLFTAPDKIHSRQILIAVDNDATPAEREAARNRAEKARDRVLAGEEFAIVARQVSDGPNALRGGNLGFTLRGQMVTSFDDQVWALEVGEISEVFESDLGYHVVKVEEIIEGPTVAFDDARSTVEGLLRQRASAEVIQNLLTEVRASAEISDSE